MYDGVLRTYNIYYSELNCCIVQLLDIVISSKYIVLVQLICRVRLAVRQVATRFISLLSGAVLLVSCDNWAGDAAKMDPIDREAGLTRDDFRTMRDVDSVKKPDPTANPGNVVEPPIPDLAEILAAPPKPKIGETQLVSLAVTDDVPLKDVLIEVARLAKVDIDVDASITGGVSLRATDRPFNEVIDRIADMAGLRYSMKNGVLRIERDTPYIKLYSLDLLNSERTSTGSISVGGASLSSSSGGSSSGGSSASINAKADSDFWAKFESSIAQILAYTPEKRTSATTISAQPAPPAAALPASSSPAAPSSSGSAAASSASGEDKAPAAPSSMKPMQAAVASPAPAAAAAPAASASSSSSSGSGGTFYVVNRQASTLTVSATAKQHEMIQQFLDKIVANTSSQVLIEAKVVEVDLSDQYQSGINWTNFGGTSFNFSGDFSKNTVSNTSIDVPTLSILKNDILRRGIDLSAAVKLLDEFGTTRALSSPRLNAVNNQQAVLSFVESLKFFEVKLTTTDAVKDSTGAITTPAKVDVTSTPKEEPVGIILNLQPSINSDTQEITMNVRPTIKRLVKTVSDPGYEVAKATAISIVGASSAAGVALASTHSDFPQIETRELDSIVKVKSGQTLVIGGLLEDKIINTDSGVPYASEVPLFGNLFKSVDKKNTKKELVIFIRATIVGSSGSADPYDKGVYEKFIQDPRPLKF